MPACPDSAVPAPWVCFAFSALFVPFYRYRMQEVSHSHPRVLGRTQHRVVTGPSSTCYCPVSSSENPLFPEAQHCRHRQVLLWEVLWELLQL